MSDALAATQMALAREQKLTDLGGLLLRLRMNWEHLLPRSNWRVLSSSRLNDEDLREDAALIRDQADRCRDILRSMGQAGKDDLHLRHAPFAAVIREAAEPHADRGIALHYDIAPSPIADLRQPVIERRPEIISWCAKPCTKRSRFCSRQYLD